ncbi:MAG TPA: FkbM family methyltransferase [Aggregatilineales bacterium]|nr:FkbM family methyltransferase [Anaerolineales bacterium]HRE48525.1 FkbM family methyltransferase [Aggregatilineales bacterium]
MTIPPKQVLNTRKRNRVEFALWKLFYGYYLRALSPLFIRLFGRKPRPYTVSYNLLIGPYVLVMRLMDGIGMPSRLIYGTEVPQRLIFLPYISAGALCVDVRAHVGDYMVEIALKTGERGKVVAYEAIPSYVALVEQTIRANGLTHATVRHAVVGEVAGEVFLPASDTNYSAAVKNTAQAETDTITVPRIALDDHFFLH